MILFLYHLRFAPSVWSAVSKKKKKKGLLAPAPVRTRQGNIINIPELHLKPIAHNSHNKPTCEQIKTRTNTNPNDTEANAGGRNGNARALRKQSKCGVYHEGEGHWPKLSQKLQKASHLWVARTPQKQ